MTRTLVLFALIVLLVLPAAAQEKGSGSGAIRISSRSFNYERHVYPTLFAVDESGRVIPATDETGGLVIGWTYEYGDFVSEDGDFHGKTLITYTLRDDLSWADGVPITAYDVFYSHELNRRQFGFGVYVSENSSLASQLFAEGRAVAAPLSATRFAVLFTVEGCAGLEAALNVHVKPAHAHLPGFAETVAEVITDSDSIFEANDKASDAIATIMTTTPGGDDGASSFNVISPQHQYVEVRANAWQRFLIGDLAFTQSFRVVDAADEVEAFISGDLDVIINPPFSRRADLRGIPDVNIVEQVGRRWYALGFNFADPAHPQSAFDEKTGEPLDQGVHPVFGDPTVRQAIRMALDIDTLGAAATAGHYTRLVGDQLPWSWAYNPDLSTPIYDPLEAGRMLEAAGWRDWNRDGVRECHGCATAETDTPLSFSLVYNSDDLSQSILARGISEQLRRIDVQVNESPVSSFDTAYIARAQNFGAYILDIDEQQPVAADRSTLFRRDEDVLFTGANVTSYVNPELDAAFDRAASAPQCDYDARAAALREASAIIHEDIPYLPLFAVNDFYAAQGAVDGFAPRQNDPFWNMADWTVNR